MCIALLLDCAQAGGQALLDSVRVQQAARDWDSEGVAEGLQAIRKTLLDLCFTIKDHQKKADAKHIASDSVDSRRLLSAFLQLSQEEGCDSALQPSGVFAAVGALLGIQAPLQGRGATTVSSAGPGGNTKFSSVLYRAQEDAAASKTPVQDYRGTNVPGYIAAVVAGPSVAGFAQHCWEALEGASSGDCPFVGAREYAVLEAFDKCALSLSELYERLSEMHAHFLCPVVVADEKAPPSSTLLEPPVHLPFLRNSKANAGPSNDE
jgi:hypothetical protein